jgi:phosphatidylglycerol:prolipoprotein diacylglycerol transferase
MLPILELGPWQVSTYQVAVSAGLLIGGMWAFHRLFGLGYPPGIIIRGFMLAILSGFAGTYGITYLISVTRVARSGRLAQPEGISIIWAMAGAVAVTTVYCRRYRISLGRALDMAALPLPLGQAIGRLGCFAAGCCYGIPTASWLGMYLPDQYGIWMVRYPTQLMSAAADLLIFFIVLAAERYGIRRAGKNRGWPFDGFLVLLYIALFSLKRFAMAFLRQSGAIPMVGPLSWMHVNALVGLVAATALIFWNLYQGKRGKRSHEGES